MMDLKELIKWFIPCFHILLKKQNKMGNCLMLFCLFLLFNPRPSYCADINSVGLVDDVENTKNVINLDYLISKNQSDIQMEANEERSMDTSVGRTFGRPLKKMMQALIPLAFQIGAASTWAIVAALVGVKTLAVTLLILKLLLLAGAVKFGAFFAQKSHHGGGSWEQSPQKDIHLHIHNGHNGPEEHIPVSSWSRDGNTQSTDSKNVNYVLNPYTGVLSKDGSAAVVDTKNVNFVLNPYAGGPQTIHTPYGNYVKVDNGNPITK